MTTTKPFLDVEDVAAILGVTPASVKTMVERWRNPNYLRGSTVAHEGNPPRLPNGPAGSTIWIPLSGETLADVAQAIRHWRDNQPGQTRKPAGETAKQFANRKPPKWWARRDEKRYLVAADIGRVLGRERQARALTEGRKDPGNKPLTAAYVRQLVWRYAHPESGYRRARLRTSSDPNAAVYAANPMPAPNGPPPTCPMSWIPEPGRPLTDLETSMCRWYRAQPGQGSRGRKPATSRSHKTRKTSKTRKTPAST